MAPVAKNGNEKPPASKRTPPIDGPTIIPTPKHTSVNACILNAKNVSNDFQKESLMSNTHKKRRDFLRKVSRNESEGCREVWCSSSRTAKSKNEGQPEVSHTRRTPLQSTKDYSTPSCDEQSNCERELGSQMRNQHASQRSKDKLPEFKDSKDKSIESGRNSFLLCLWSKRVRFEG